MHHFCHSYSFLFFKVQFSRLVYVVSFTSGLMYISEQQRNTVYLQGTLLHAKIPQCLRSAKALPAMIYWRLLFVAISLGRLLFASWSLREREDGKINHWSGEQVHSF